MVTAVGAVSGIGVAFHHQIDFTVNQTVPVGQLAVISMSFRWPGNGASSTSATITDPRGNTWFRRQDQRGSTYGTFMAVSVLTTELQSGDIITYDTGSTADVGSAASPLYGTIRSFTPTSGKGFVFVQWVGRQAAEAVSTTLHNVSYTENYVQRASETTVDFSLAYHSIEGNSANISSQTSGWTAESTLTGTTVRYARINTRENNPVGSNMSMTTSVAYNGLAQAALFDLPAVQTVTGSAGIASAEAFGTTGPTVTLTAVGSTGIASAETFGAGAAVQLAVVGSAGIPSEETFGLGGGAGPAQTVTGSTGIPSAETFGTPGQVSVVVTGATGITSAEVLGTAGAVTLQATGTAGIPSGETFGSGGLARFGPIIGTVGIASGETFGAGEVRFVVTGTAGIPSAETFGVGGFLRLPVITGLAGIPSAEAFGSFGRLVLTITGTAGIPSSQAFGSAGAVGFLVAILTDLEFSVASGPGRVSVVTDGPAATPGTAEGPSRAHVPLTGPSTPQGPVEGVSRQRYSTTGPRT